MWLPENPAQIARSILDRKGDSVVGVEAFQKSLIERPDNVTVFHTLAKANMPITPICTAVVQETQEHFPATTDPSQLTKNLSYMLLSYLSKSAGNEHLRPIDIAASQLAHRSYRDLIDAGVSIAPAQNQVHPVQRIISAVKNLDTETLFPEETARDAGKRAVKMLEDSKDDAHTPIALESGLHDLIEGISQIAEIAEPLAGMFFLEFARVWREAHPKDPQKFWYPDGEKQPGVIEKLAEAGKDKTVEVLRSSDTVPERAFPETQKAHISEKGGREYD